jgi:hypothetical protein
MTRKGAAGTLSLTWSRARQSSSLKADGMRPMEIAKTLNIGTGLQAKWRKNIGQEVQK